MHPIFSGLFRRHGPGEYQFNSRGIWFPEKGRDSSNGFWKVVDLCKNIADTYTEVSQKGNLRPWAGRVRKYARYLLYIPRSSWYVSFRHFWHPKLSWKISLKLFPKELLRLVVTKHRFSIGETYPSTGVTMIYHKHGQGLVTGTVDLTDRFYAKFSRETRFMNNSQRCPYHLWELFME